MRYRDLAYTNIHQRAAFPAESLFGEVGGQLGLCLGASLISMVEIVDLVLTVCGRCLACVRRRRGRKVGEKGSEIESGVTEVENLEEQQSDDVAVGIV